MLFNYIQELAMTAVLSFGRPDNLKEEWQLRMTSAARLRYRSTRYDSASPSATSTR
jgi:hypothetical protein